MFTYNRSITVFAALFFIIAHAQPVAALKTLFTWQDKEFTNRLQEPHEKETFTGPLDTDEIEYLHTLSKQVKKLDIIGITKGFLLLYHPKTPYAGTNNEKILVFGPKFHTLSNKQKIFCILHELGHIAFTKQCKKNYLDQFIGYYATLIKKSVRLFTGAKNKNNKQTVPLGQLEKDIDNDLQNIFEQRSEYAADAYAAANCPDTSYIQEAITLLNEKPTSNKQLDNVGKHPKNKSRAKRLGELLKK